jgi:preprotein translocase subunit SecF
MGEDHDGCMKPDAWEAQRERNLRYERTFEKIEGHMAAQTAVMVELARQGAENTFIVKRLEEFKSAQEILFKQVRVQGEKLTEHEMAEGTASVAASRTLKNGALLAIIVAAIGILVKQVF